MEKTNIYNIFTEMVKTSIKIKKIRERKKKLEQEIQEEMAKLVKKLREINFKNSQ